MYTHNLILHGFQMDALLRYKPWRYNQKKAWANLEPSDEHSLITGVTIYCDTPCVRDLGALFGHVIKQPIFHLISWTPTC